MENLIYLASLITLVLVIALLCYLLYKLNESIKRERQDFKAERQDYVNRLLSKSTADYKELTKVGNITGQQTEEEVPDIRRTKLDKQLEEMGALERGAQNMYSGM